MPAPGELHLWQWTVDSKFDSSLLSAEEKARHERFVVDEPRRQFLAAHAGMRLVLGSYLQTSAANLEFAALPDGKPVLAIDTSLQFNLSHSSDCVLLAVATCEVGVDVEHVREVKSLASLAGKHFTHRECEQVLAASGAEQLASFFRLWTRKEAAVKLTGLGLKAGVSELEVSSDAAWQGDVALPANWGTLLTTAWIADVAVDSAYHAAVATEQKPSRVEVFRLAPLPE